MGDGSYTRGVRKDGWAHLVAAIDCHDRQLIGWEFALRGRAKEAEGAIEEAMHQTLRHTSPYRACSSHQKRQ